VLSCDAVVLETGTPVAGCSDRENSSADGISKNLIRARCEGPVRDLGAVSAGRRLLRPDDLRTPGGVAVCFSVVGHPTGPTRDRCAIGDRRNERSANLRAIGALGAARRPPQLSQESRSPLPAVAQQGARTPCEQARQLSEVGAGLGLQQNAQRVLVLLDLGPGGAQRSG
jgi:hypothetical protein